MQHMHEASAVSFLNPKLNFRRDNEFLLISQTLSPEYLIGFQLLGSLANRLKHVPAFDIGEWSPHYHSILHDLLPGSSHRDRLGGMQEYTRSCY